ncbi:peptidoglycan-binding protein [Sporolactobacillus mangiferae]|uniref:peptidoglycan-binding protein n=1 Tax=Sporolactobacillus mangiferae TaxID=2940498 RepID=UPI0024B34607|nr:peptidoglycan-binding protein [Sporolactobacillus mangiferae]
MAEYSIHAGHNAFVPGAHGYIKEEVVNRQIKEAAIKYLRLAGQTVYDDTDDAGKTQNENLAAIVRKINAHSGLTLAVSVHLNAGRGSGIEVYQYDSKTNAVAARVLKNICSVTGLPDRGVKRNQSLYVLRNTVPPAILIECGFVDTKKDAAIIAGKSDSVGKAIAEGILGSPVKTVGTTKSAESKKSASARTNTLLQRGDQGTAVRRLQQQLIQAGYNVGSAGADGVFGPATEVAVRALQKRNGLIDDGIFGPATKQALSHSAKKKEGATASAIVPYPGMLIKRGSRGQDVARIQRALSLTADGIFGPKTETAVRSYQKRHGLTVDGIVGPKTWNTLF